mmetsp:Transcript_97392/g.275362  ORF Transcript_97392/g.275362 Transcript_97392/m.275362 type:complete len:501 (-) Transcript_97392:845-2347(-)
MLFDQLHVDKLGVPAVSDVCAADLVWLIDEVEVQATGVQSTVEATVVVGLGRHVLLTIAPGHHLVVRPQEELLRVHVQMGGEAAAIEIVIHSILPEVAALSDPIVVDPTCIAAHPAVHSQPRKSVGVLNDDRGKEVGEAVWAVTRRLRLPHEFQHEVGTQSKACEVALGPRGPTGHGDPVDHVGGHVLVQLPLRGLLAQLVLVSRLCLDGLGRPILPREVEQRAFGGPAASRVGSGRHEGALRASADRSGSTGAGAPSGRRGSAINEAVRQRADPRALVASNPGPALVEVGELVSRASAAELFKELIEGDGVVEGFPRGGRGRWQVHVGERQRRGAANVAHAGRAHIWHLAGPGHACERRSRRRVLDSHHALGSGPVVIRPSARHVELRRVMLALVLNCRCWGRRGLERGPLHTIAYGGCRRTQQGLQVRRQGEIVRDVSPKLPAEGVHLRAKAGPRDPGGRGDGVAHAKLAHGQGLAICVQGPHVCGRPFQAHVAIEYE